MPTQANSKGPQTLNDLPSAAPESIVSKMLLKTRCGSATHFSFAEGEFLDDHATPFEALLIVLSGKAEVSVSLDHYVLDAGDFIRLPANVPHSVRAPEDMQMLLIMLRTDSLPNVKGSRNLQHTAD